MTSPKKAEWEKEFDAEFSCTCGGSPCGNVVNEHIIDDLKSFIHHTHTDLLTTLKERGDKLKNEIIEKEGLDNVSQMSQVGSVAYYYLDKYQQEIDSLLVTDKKK